VAVGRSSTMRSIRRTRVTTDEATGNVRTVAYTCSWKSCDRLKNPRLCFTASAGDRLRFSSTVIRTPNRTCHGRDDREKTTSVRGTVAQKIELENGHERAQNENARRLTRLGRKRRRRRRAAVVRRLPLRTVVGKHVVRARSRVSETRGLVIGGRARD
jgi:hypothetical protein